jgi:hypothetical protein
LFYLLEADCQGEVPALIGGKDFEFLAILVSITVWIHCIDGDWALVQVEQSEKDGKLSRWNEEEF